MGGNRHSIFGDDAVIPPPPVADEAEESKKKLKMIDYEDEEEGNQVSSPLNSDEEEEVDKDKDEDEDEYEVEDESGEDPKPIGDVVRVSGKGKSTRNHFKGFEYDGRSYELEDTVLLAPEEQSLKPSVAIIKDITEMQDGSVIITVQRFYRPEEAEHESNENYEGRELFYSFDKNEFPAESIMHKCQVHFIPPKKQVPTSKDHPGFIVRKIYDPKSKRLSELLNTDYDDLRRHEIGKNKFELHRELRKL